jgi:hypothetical protein
MSELFRIRDLATQEVLVVPMIDHNAVSTQPARVVEMAKDGPFIAIRARDVRLAMDDPRR